MVGKKTSRRRTSAREELVEYEGAKLVKSEAEALKSISDKLGCLMHRIRGKTIVDMNEFWYSHKVEFWAKNHHVLYLSISRKCPFRYFTRTIPPLTDDLKKFTRLKDLVLCYFILGKDIIEVPELPSLKRLELYGCSVEEGAPVPPNLFVNVKHIKGLSIKAPMFSECPSSIRELRELKELFLGNTEENFFLSSEPLSLPNLRKINFYGCKLSSFPESLCFSENIEQIVINKHRNKFSLPAAFGNLKNLKILKIEGNLTYVPETFGNLKNLECLIIKGNLPKLPSSFGNLENLKHLEIYCNSSEPLPESLGNLKSLETLIIKSPKLKNLLEVKVTDHFALRNLPEPIIRLKKSERSRLLKAADVTDHFGLRDLPESIGRLENLKRLEIISTLEKIPASIGNLRMLEKMELVGCRAESLPETVSGLTSLKYMAIGDSFRTLPKLPENVEELRITGDFIELSSEIFPPNLKSLRFCDQSGGEMPDCFSSLKSLEYLAFEGNKNKGPLPPSFGHLSSLRELVFMDCPAQIVSEVIGQLEKLEELVISGVKSVRFPENPHGLGELKQLKIIVTPLDVFPRGICALKNLRKLIINAARIEEVPECFGKLPHLELIDLFDNPIRGIPESFADLPEGCTVILGRKRLDSVSRKIIKKMKERGIKVKSRPK